jgi:hypothetical protein
VTRSSPCSLLYLVEGSSNIHRYEFRCLSADLHDCCAPRHPHFSACCNFVGGAAFQSRRQLLIGRYVSLRESMCPFFLYSPFACCVCALLCAAALIKQNNREVQKGSSIYIYKLKTHNRGSGVLCEASSSHPPTNLDPSCVVVYHKHTHTHTYTQYLRRIISRVSSRARCNLIVTCSIRMLDVVLALTILKLL